jgi:hypothetical protein
MSAAIGYNGKRRKTKANDFKRLSKNAIPEIKSKNAVSDKIVRRFLIPEAKFPSFF